LITVSFQIENHSELKRTMSTLRAYMASLGLSTELDQFLDLWDDAVRRSDFSDVAAAYPTLITSVLVKCRDTDQTDSRSWPTTLEGHLELIESIFLPPPNDIEVAAEEIDFEDACVGLGSILETMEHFRDPDSYFEVKHANSWDFDHFDAETLGARDPTLLWDFVFELDVFLTACLETRCLLPRQIENAFRRLSVSNFGLL